MALQSIDLFSSLLSQSVFVLTVICSLWLNNKPAVHKLLHTIKRVNYFINLPSYILLTFLGAPIHAVIAWSLITTELWNCSAVTRQLSFIVFHNNRQKLFSTTSRLSFSFLQFNHFFYFSNDVINSVLN